jgi:hypothetical protein
VSAEKGRFGTKIDVKNAYHMLVLALAVRHFFTFRTGCLGFVPCELCASGQTDIWSCHTAHLWVPTTPPMGMACSGAMLNIAATEPVCREAVRALGAAASASFRVGADLDDMCCVGTIADSQFFARHLRYLFEGFGWQLQETKLQIAVPRGLDYLGWTFDLDTNEVSMRRSTFEKLVAKLHLFAPVSPREGGRVPAEWVMSVAGMVAHACRVYASARAWSAHILKLSFLARGNRFLVLDQPAIDELAFWRRFVSSPSLLSQPMAVVRSCAGRFCAFTDASGGVSPTLGGFVFGLAFSFPALTCPYLVDIDIPTDAIIHVWELAAVLVAVRVLAKHRPAVLRNALVRICVDNTGAIADLRRGRTRQAALQSGAIRVLLLRALYLELAPFNAAVAAEYIASSRNRLADALSRPNEEASFDDFRKCVRSWHNSHQSFALAWASPSPFPGPAW